MTPTFLIVSTLNAQRSQLLEKVRGSNLLPLSFHCRISTLSSLLAPCVLCVFGWGVSQGADANETGGNAHKDARIRWECVHLQCRTDPSGRGPASTLTLDSSPQAVKQKQQRVMCHALSWELVLMPLWELGGLGKGRGDSSPSSRSAEPYEAHPTHFLGLSDANPSHAFGCVLSHVAGKPHFHHVTQLLEPLRGVLITSQPAEEAEALRSLYPGSLCAIKDFCYFPLVPALGPYLGAPVGSPCRSFIVHGSPRHLATLFSCLL